MCFVTYFPYSLTDFSKISYQISLANTAEQIMRFVKIVTVKDVNYLTLFIKHYIIFRIFVRCDKITEPHILNSFHKIPLMVLSRICNTESKIVSGIILSYIRYKHK